MGSVVHLSHVPPPDGRPELSRVLYAAEARSAWSDAPVPRERLDELHALMSLGPSMVDASPTQLLFLISRSARARLSPHLGEACRSDLAAAPACALIGYDQGFAAQLAEFLPHAAEAEWLEAPEAARQTALRNGVLQGAYLIVAARTLGLEAQAIPDFDADGVSREFFGASRMRATFLCALGFPREDRAGGAA